jgi:hypothetical protein
MIKNKYVFIAKQYRDDRRNSIYNFKDSLFEVAAQSSTQTVKHSFVNKNKENTIEYDVSYYTKQLQKGSYIKLSENSKLIA